MENYEKRFFPFSTYFFLQEIVSYRNLKKKTVFDENVVYSMEKCFNKNISD